ncbi:MAG: hypothetical protein OEL57_02230 [Trichlorobacter sp.]|uniref:hypothetical protein n=1 Tax=Trichlorobacter sp. TaxID=2911007 RepID=UPI00256CB451|nr:hypothetical protein [Trichlorobacter sp.]MDK9716708.1 hypothetical protein [Trichlorobacter sp.]
MRQKLTPGKAEATDPALHIEMETLRQEREERLNAEEAQADREARIAEAHEIAGRIQAFTFVGKVLTVTTLVQLRRIKESKAYKDIPNIGTWDKYCEYLGFSREKVDSDLKNLAEFGETFLVTVTGFGLGYRELRQLRQLKYDGESFQMSDDGKTVVIEGEAISLGDDAAPEIEAALEKLLEKNKTLRERNTRLEKDLKGAVKEEVAGLAAEKKALLERVKDLEKYEPQQLDETKYEAQYAEIHNLMSQLGGCIKAVMALDDLQDHPGTMARVDGYVEGCTYLANELRELWADQCMFKNE